MITAHVNLGEGILPHGTPEREMVVGMLLLTVRDYLKPATRAEASSWLESSAGVNACAWVGISGAALCTRLQVIVADPELCVEFNRRISRRSPATIFEALMTA